MVHLIFVTTAGCETPATSEIGGRMRSSDVVGQPMDTPTEPCSNDL